MSRLRHASLTLAVLGLELRVERSVLFTADGLALRQLVVIEVNRGCLARVDPGTLEWSIVVLRVFEVCLGPPEMVERLPKLEVSIPPGDLHVGIAVARRLLGLSLEVEVLAQLALDDGSHDVGVGPALRERNRQLLLDIVFSNYWCAESN